MKNRIHLKLVLLVLLMGISMNLLAHEGGHYHHSDAGILNTWRLANGQTIKGNFSAGTDDYIILEQYEGKMLRLPISQLSDQDQQLARFKVSRYSRLNKPVAGFILQDKGIVKNQFNPAWFLVTLLTACLLLLLLAKLIGSVLHCRENRLSYRLASFYLLSISLSAFACKKSADNISSPGPAPIPKTRTSFIDSAFAPHKPSISTSWDNNYFYVASTGFPQHNMMVGITSWQQQVPVPQFYTGSNSWSIPLQPEYAAIPLSTKTNLMKGAVAIAVNGIPIFNAYNNRGVDAYLVGELDNWGGHCGRADDYHYHAAPLHLAAAAGNMPIAFALDGFPVYAASEPDGTAMQSLDTCHGHSINNGLYHYHGTTNYPYVVGAMRGKVNLDPSTPAPENQVLPQAFASPVRPALTPLNGATITAFQSAGVNAYKLTYQRGTKPGYVEYSWDAANKYTYKSTDTAGVVTINVYQR